MTIRSGNLSKRSSGRTGSRRLTLEQTKLLGADAIRDYQRRNGKPQALPPLAEEPPAWFTEPLIAIWQDVLTSAASGAFAGIDHPSLVAYCVAILTHRRLAQQIVAMDDPVALEPRLRAAATEVRAAAKALG